MQIVEFDRTWIPGRDRLTALSRAVLLFFTFQLGGCSISVNRKPVELHWQWAEGRQPTQRVVMRLDHVAPWDGGPLGVGKSPSMPTGFLDPIEIRGSVLAHGPGWNTSGVTLVLPAEELQDAHVGDRVALAILEGDYNLCICVAKVPGERDGASLAAWLAGWKCQTVGQTIREQSEGK